MRLRLPRYHLLALPLSLLLFGAGLLAGCPDDIELIPSFPAGCEAEPVFNLLSPNPEGTQEFTNPPATMDLNIDVGNFSIVDKPGEPNGPCEGHFHVSIDGGAIDVVTSPNTTQDISALEEGEHTISITVHNNDHSRIEEIPAFGTTFLVDVED